MNSCVLLSIVYEEAKCSFGELIDAMLSSLAKSLTLNVIAMLKGIVSDILC